MRPGLENIEQFFSRDLKSSLWLVFDHLRSEKISSGDYNFILILLSLYKDKILYDNTNLNKEEIIAQIDTALRKREYDFEDIYLKIYKIFEPILHSVSDRGLKSVIKVICNLDHKFLSEDFPNLFDSVLYDLAQSQGRHGGEFIQPLEITRFISGIFEIPRAAKIYNPFAGLASFGVNLDKGQYYFGQEINKWTWAIGALRLKAYDRPVTSRYVCDDSIYNWPNPSDYFDFIFANPPYGMQLNQQYTEVDPNIRSIEHFLIEKGVSSLSAKGKLIALLPQGFLSRGKNEQRLRKHLIDEDLIDTIISLPGGILQNTSIPLTILVLDKDKKMPGKVRFIDAKRFVDGNKSKKKILNDDRLNIVFQSFFQDSDQVRVIDNSRIRQYDYSLNVPRYFQNDIELASNERLIKLKDILVDVRGQRGDFPETGKLIRIRDLRNDKVDHLLDLSIIQDVELSKPSIYQINESCLLLASHWRTLKPTHFVYEGTPIFKSQDILSFKINESLADFSYVINELHSDYVQDQLESYQMGTAIPFIRKDDLLEIVIKLPSLQEQKAKVKGIVELSNEIRILQEKLNSNVIKESASNYIKESSLKHRLGTPLLNIGSSLRNIESALSRNYISWEETKLNERYSITLRDSFDSIHQTLKTVNQILIANESEIDFSNKKLEDIDFLAFIKRYVNRIISAERSNVNTKLDIHPDFKIQLKNKVLIQGNTELLEIALNAIVENANMHAFTDISKKYTLEFRVSLYVAPSVNKPSEDTIGRFDTYIKVEAANNGKPFPKNYSLDKLIRKNSFAGETGNTGQGGFDLNEIIKYHNNGMSTLELVTADFTTDFSTTYSFLLPLNR